MNNGGWNVTASERTKARRMRQCKACGVKRGQACVNKHGVEYVTYVHAVRTVRVSKGK